MFAERLLKELKKPQTDWRTVLNDFVQQEIVDYSFTPPDRRFDESPFFLPDFNVKDDLVEDILFMIAYLAINGTNRIRGFVPP